MNKKFLSTALVATMGIASGVTVIAAENSEIVGFEEAIDSGMVRRTAGQTVVIDKDITLDLNGKLLSSSGVTALRIEDGAKVKIINGTINSDTETIKIISGIVTLESVMIETKSNTGNVVSIDSGNITFKNITLKKPIDSKKSYIVAKNNVVINLQGNINAEDVSKDYPLIECTDNNDNGLKINAEDTILNNVGASYKKDEIYKKPSKVDTDDESGGGGISKPDYSHTKIIGKDRYETAALLADKVGNYDTVILVNTYKTMADGLSAASLAGKLNAPILPVKQNKIPDSVMKRIEKAKNVYIIGGTEAISKDVEKQLSSKKITRIGGDDRFETSEKIASTIGSYSKAYIVNGVTGEADAMSISPVVAKNKAPIIVTDGKKSSHVKKSGTDYTVIGGEKAVTKELAKKYSADRISGDNRYETNREVIEKFYYGAGTIYFANGETMIDALTASLVAKNNGVALVGPRTDNSVLKGKDTVQVGGMKFDVDFE